MKNTYRFADVLPLLPGDGWVGVRGVGDHEGPGYEPDQAKHSEHVEHTLPTKLSRQVACRIVILVYYVYIFNNNTVCSQISLTFKTCRLSLMK